MKVIILAGGFGTRLSEYTADIPKPMVPVGGRPILWHIMAIFAYYGHKEFFLALGYKSEVIKEYFLNYRTLNSNFTVDLKTGVVQPHQLDEVDWKVTLINTGNNSMTGARVRKLKSFIGNETCFLTYGDGLSDVDLKKLLAFHKSHGKLITVTAVHPGARFGELTIKNETVTAFQEKPQTLEGWINGGFFVVEPGFFNMIDEGEQTILEKNPLEKVARLGELVAYKHEGFWQCMDTKRDKDNLEKLWQENQAPWAK